MISFSWFKVTILNQFLKQFNILFTCLMMMPRLAVAFSAENPLIIISEYIELLCVSQLESNKNVLLLSMKIKTRN